MSKIRFTLVMTGAVAVAITLAACSSTSGSASMDGMNNGGNGSSATSTSNTGLFNDSDVAFAMGMVPHHQQAVEMADIILKKEGIDSNVIALATTIKTAQGPEITTMKAWLTSWGSPTDMSGMQMGNGMMSDADMSALAASTGLAASKLFLQQMTQHHQGAIAMATVQMNGGKNADAVALAHRIVTAQTAEIAQMAYLLSTL